MKKVLTIIIIGLLFVFVSTSCEPEEPEEKCKNCKTVTYDANDSIISQTALVEYCGDELEDIENEPPVVVGGETTRYECE